MSTDTTTKKEDITINELMDFLVENMVTKEEFNGLDNKVNSLTGVVNSLKSDVEIIKQDISHINVRLDNIDKEIADIKASLARLEKTTFEDSSASTKEIEKLKARVEYLEKIMNVKKLQTA